MTCWWHCDYCGAKQDGTAYPEDWEYDGGGDACADCQELAGQEETEDESATAD